MRKRRKVSSLNKGRSRRRKGEDDTQVGRNAYGKQL
jgi:hypothetical protein